MEISILVHPIVEVSFDYTVIHLVFGNSLFRGSFFQFVPQVTSPARKVSLTTVLTTRDERESGAQYPRCFFFYPQIWCDMTSTAYLCHFCIQKIQKPILWLNPHYARSVILPTSESSSRLLYVVDCVYSVSTFAFSCTDVAAAQSHFLPCGRLVFI